MKPLVLLLVLCMLVGGCHAKCPFPCPIWTDGKAAFSTVDFEIQIPQGWMQMNLNWLREDLKTEGIQLLLVRDGVTLQEVRLIKRPLNAAFLNSKESLAQDMLPQEMGEAMFRDVQADSAKLNPRLIQGAPATIGGSSGFVVVYSYVNNDGLKRKTVEYGVIYESWFYALTYDAPAQYYFDKSLSEFQTMVLSFRPLPSVPSHARLS